MTPSNKFLELASKIAKRDKALFDALLEFEQTKKLRTKVRLDFTINKSLASQFRKYCKDHGYTMSAKVEQAMKRILEEENNPHQHK